MEHLIDCVVVDSKKLVLLTHDDANRKAFALGTGVGIEILVFSLHTVRKA
jgi:hypothetical protein